MVCKLSSTKMGIARVVLRSPLAAILPLLARRLRLPVPLGLNFPNSRITGNPEVIPHVDRMGAVKALSECGNPSHDLYMKRGQTAP
jgi:hypothetical protein